MSNRRRRRRKHAAALHPRRVSPRLARSFGFSDERHICASSNNTWRTLAPGTLIGGVARSRQTPTGSHRSCATQQPKKTSEELLSESDAQRTSKARQLCSTQLRLLKVGPYHERSYICMFVCISEEEEEEQQQHWTRDDANADDERWSRPPSGQL